jgi:hypothetical protein
LTAWAESRASSGQGATAGPDTTWPGIALLAVTSGVQQAVRYRRPLHAIFLPFCFFLYHFIHGLGVLYSLLRLATGTAPVQRKAEPWPGAGFRRFSPRAHVDAVSP